MLLLLLLPLPMPWNNDGVDEDNDKAGEAFKASRYATLREPMVAGDAENLNDDPENEEKAKTSIEDDVAGIIPLRIIPEKKIGVTTAMAITIMIVFVGAGSGALWCWSGDNLSLLPLSSST